MGGNNNYFAGRVLVHNCQHLEAVTFGRLNRLLINVWPGAMKSMLVSVLWPAWEWGPCGKRSLRYLATAYNDEPSTRDNRKCRDLIASPWYQDLWPEVKLTRRAETSFANSDTGTRDSLPFGSLTGQRGDRLILDDPHSVKTSESDVDRDKTTRLFREGALNRLNDADRSAIVVIMQRLHEKDVSGVILKEGMPFVHIMLPMEFEPERRCVTDLGFADPRTFDGELADPVRYSRAYVDQQRRDMRDIAFAGQYQQRPAPREGASFKRHWFAERVMRPEAVPPLTKWVRHWDLAASTKKTSARTAGVKMGRTPDGRFIVANVITTRSEGDAVRALIKGTAEIDGKRVEISLPQDPGQAGKVQRADMVRMLAGYNVHVEPETGDKVMRAEPFAAQCDGGNVWLVDGPWVEGYLDELCGFPTADLKDQVDASSAAFGRLISYAFASVPMTAPIIISNPTSFFGVPLGNF